MSERENMLNGKPYDPTDKELTSLRIIAHRLSQQYNLTVLDTCPVNIGDNVFFGPNCTIATALHFRLCLQDSI